MVSMCGIKLGDRLLVIGGSDVPLIAALAVKSGLTGRACVVDESEATRDHVGPAVEKEGGLIESFAAPLTALPFASESFDVVVARNFLRSVSAATSNAAASEIHRVVRPGGRCVLIDDSGRGLSSLVGGERADGSPGEGGATGLLASAGFRGVRRLAEREGHAFVEGVKAGQGGS
jgi:ubiquinone/menaquinone biosynthesis C-methylase UbiE